MAVNPYPHAEALLTHLRDQLTAAPDPPATISLRAGDTEAGVTVYEDEALRGLAYVRVAGLWPTASFPERMETWRPEGALGWALTLEMGVLRAAPVGSATRLPTPAAWADAIRQQMTDAACMQEAARVFGETLDTEMYLVGEWVEVPPLGGRMGGTLSVAVLLDGCEE